MSAKWTLRLGAVTVLLLCCGLFAWVGFDLEQSRARELVQAERSALTLARLLEGHIKSTAQRFDLQLSDFVARHQFDVAERISRDKLDAELADNLARFPEAHSFRVAGADGNYIYDGSGSLSSVNIGDRDYFLRLRDNPKAGLVVSPPLLSRVTGDVVVVFARRLEDRSGNFSGIVLATLRADYFEQFYRQLEVGSNGVIALWGKNLELFARRPSLPEWQGKRLPDSYFSGLLASGLQTGTFDKVAVLDGERRVFAFRVLDDFPLIVTVGLAERDFLAEWWRRVAVYGVLMGVLLIASVALIRAWSRSYLQVKALARSMASAYEEKTREARALLDSIPDPAWLLDTDGRYLAVNEAFCRYKSLPMDAVIGHTVEELFSPEDAKRLRAGQLEVYAKGGPVRQQVRLEMGGKNVPFEFLRVPVYGENGEPRGLAGVAWDMSERYEAEERQRLITHFFDHSNDAVLILDRERHVLTLNNAVTAISGYRLEELKGKQPRFMVEGCDNRQSLELISRQLDEQGIWRGELQAKRKDGSPLPIYCSVSGIRDDEGKVVNWAVFVTDLSERKATEARIHSLIHIDQLTGLPNRSGFTQIVGEWLAAGRPGTLILVDLDQLSRINDAFGYEEGDLMLTKMSIRLRKVLREGDALGRLGGDQFGILATQGGGPGSIEAIARKLLDCIAQPMMIEGSEVVATACAGICLLGEDGQDVASLMRNADAALHHAKDSGHNIFRFFAGDMNVRMAERLRLESDLRSALGRGELVLYYQPQVDLASGDVVGFESLIRWRHPELGLVPPDRFIPLAEESRLILPIGAWVLEEACRQNQAWQAAGMKPRVVAVNLSALQFHSADLVDSVARALQRSGLPPACLELEITESVLVQDPEHVVHVMEQLKGLGVSLSLDDFGTGYSSLAYLKRFPLDRIKIDRSFIRDLEHDANDAAIVRMVIGIGAELERRVVAEGVETPQQLEFLRRHGCGDYQGFYFSPPVPAERIPELLSGKA